MSEWISFYDEAIEIIEEFGDECLLFRGHSVGSWRLMPGLGRLGLESHTVSEMEQIAYFDFLTRAGDLLPASNDSWSNIFVMQHHGLPTRLLDWTETFGVALYFALRDGDGDAAVWILNPFKLNKATINREQVIHPTGLNGNYEDYYLERTKVLEGSVIAMSPLRHNPRVFHQRAGFTLHDNLQTPLEDMYPEALRKIVIPKGARSGAIKFLKIAGISEFSLFPDLDGLSRELMREHFAVVRRPRAKSIKDVPRTKKSLPSTTVATDGLRRR